MLVKSDANDWSSRMQMVVKPMQLRTYAKHSNEYLISDIDPSDLPLQLTMAVSVRAWSHRPSGTSCI